jgi:hypothetical protein
MAVRTEDDTPFYFLSDPALRIPVIDHLRNTIILRARMVEIERGGMVLTTPLAGELFAFQSGEPFSKVPTAGFLDFDSMLMVLVVPPLLCGEIVPVFVIGERD